MIKSMSYKSVTGDLKNVFVNRTVKSIEKVTDDYHTMRVTLEDNTSYIIVSSYIKITETA